MTVLFALAALSGAVLSVEAYVATTAAPGAPAGRYARPAFSRPTSSPACVRRPAPLRMSEGGGENIPEAEVVLADDATAEEKEEAVENLVANDEWDGLGMELGELIKTAIVEDAKANAREFLGKDGYQLGDVSKEIDARVKLEVAKLRGKDEYELGDLSAAMDKIAKDMTCDLTGKDDYEFGDLSVEIDTRIKSTVASFCGKEAYEFGDLSKEVDKRAKVAVAEFTGSEDYKFGDISTEIMKRRKAWVIKNYGEDAVANYRFGMLTKSAVSSFTGKDEYEFGDISKKVFGGLFKKK